VLTGGPCGGKTTFLRELRRIDPDAQRFVLVPEAATQLIEAGLRPGSKEFQRGVFRLQSALESACAIAAPPGALLVCDRGLLDGLVYWRLLGGTEGEFFEMAGLGQGDLLARYQMVLHLQTAAVGADASYTSLGLRRVESPELAMQIDHLCGEIWGGHPGYSLIENSEGGWTAKCTKARDKLESLFAATDSSVP
jgi:hypothetical protein